MESFAVLASFRRRLYFAFIHHSERFFNDDPTQRDQQTCDASYDANNCAVCRNPRWISEMNPTANTHIVGKCPNRGILNVLIQVGRVICGKWISSPTHPQQNILCTQQGWESICPSSASFMILLVKANAWTRPDFWPSNLILISSAPVDFLFFVLDIARAGSSFPCNWKVSFAYRQAVSPSLSLPRSLPVCDHPSNLH